MIIIHPIDDFLFSLFPKAKEFENNLESLKDFLKEFYSFGPFKPEVLIQDNYIKINIDTNMIQDQEKDFRKVVSLCEKGNFNEAKMLLIPLIKKNPTNSEFNRIMGQIYSDEGQQNEAINYLIDALRWDPKNTYALLMMGNIYAKYKDNISTAMKYYDQVIKINPSDHVALNNIGANLIKLGRKTEAKIYFDRANAINPNYPNTHYALALIADMEEDFEKAFYFSVESLKKASKNTSLYQEAYRLAFQSAKKLISSNIGLSIFNKFCKKLETEDGKDIEVISDETIPTAAKIEFAEFYNRDRHIIRFNPFYPAVDHLKLHELGHLHLSLIAKKEHKNKVFLVQQEQKSLFIKKYENFIFKLNKKGIAENTIAEVMSSLFDGISRQIHNTPVDLYIEDFIFNTYPEMRPYQFISLNGLVKESIKAVTNKNIIETFPDDILSHSKIYNLVFALYLKDKYGLDYISDLKSTPIEFRQAESFFNEFKKFRTHQPGFEYKFVQQWAYKLKLEKYFSLIDENEFHIRLHEGKINLAERPESKSDDRVIRQKEKDIQDFQKSQRDIGFNMAVVMFMVDALQYFDKIPQADIRKIAFQIAMIGRNGIRPDSKGYKVSGIPGKEFSGYHLLAYYYVSFAIAIPDVLRELGLPFAEEYKAALKLHKPD
jgi:tetratricopeptide (TPR) repeat protein